jgi:hypothetical protein
MESEQNIVAKKILDHYGLATDNERLESLADLEYLLHNIDNAQTFIDHGGNFLCYSCILHCIFD